MAHQHGAYPRFCSIKRLGVSLLLDGMLVHCRTASQLKLLPITCNVLLRGVTQSNFAIGNFASRKSV
jgi:hypothetical protein